MAELSNAARKLKQAQGERPSTHSRWPSDFGGNRPTIGEALDAYTAEHNHRRPSFAYIVTNTFTEFLNCNALDEGQPVFYLQKDHCKAYKTGLMNGTLVKRGRRKAGAVTIARKLACVHHFVKWCVNNDHLDRDIMAGLALPVRAVSAAKLVKEGFTDNELERIVQTIPSMVIRGTTSQTEWCWVILLLMHTGCRVTEVLQLLTSDVRQEGNIWYIDINGTGAGQQLKNRASIRQVPIHSNLLKAGFIEWYQAQKDSRLFPELYPYGAVKVSLTFSRLLKRLKIKRPTVTLHSLRHSVAIRLERARVHYSLMRRVLGHTIGSGTEDRIYLGSLKYPIKELAEELEKVSFPS